MTRKIKKISVKGEFAAPLSKVWAAWTESELLDKWWAPKPWQVQTKSMNSALVSIEIKYDEISDLEKYIEMGFKEGFTAGLENLDELLS